MMRIDILTKAGTCRNGFERDSGRVSHAVPRDEIKALCGTEPGRTSVGWSAYASDKVTCPRCLAKMTKMQAAA